MVSRVGRKAAEFVELNRAAASMIHGSPQNPKEAIPKAGQYTMVDQLTAVQLNACSPQCWPSGLN